MKNIKMVGETFEQWISRTMGETDVKVDENDIKLVMKLRDSGRVCFLENKKKFENTEDVLGNGKLPETEIEITKNDLVKFADRARKYLARYVYASEILKRIRAIEAETKLKEKEVTGATDETLTDTNEKE